MVFFIFERDKSQSFTQLQSCQVMHKTTAQIFACFITVSGSEVEKEISPVLDKCFDGFFRFLCHGRCIGDKKDSILGQAVELGRGDFFHFIVQRTNQITKCVYFSSVLFKRVTAFYIEQCRWF